MGMSSTSCAPDQPLVIPIPSQRRHPRGSSVSEALADHVEFELCHGREHVQLEASDAASLDVEDPRYDREHHAATIERRDEAGPIGQLPREPVDAVDDDSLPFTGFDAIEEPLESR